MCSSLSKTKNKSKEPENLEQMVKYLAEYKNNDQYPKIIFFIIRREGIKRIHLDSEEGRKYLVETGAEDWTAEHGYKYATYPLYECDKIKLSEMPKDMIAICLINKNDITEELRNFFKECRFHQNIGEKDYTMNISTKVRYDDYKNDYYEDNLDEDPLCFSNCTNNDYKKLGDSITHTGMLFEKSYHEECDICYKKIAKCDICHRTSKYMCIGEKVMLCDKEICCIRAGYVGYVYMDKPCYQNCCGGHFVFY